MEEIEVDRVIQLCDNYGQPLIKKYSCDALVSLLDRGLLQRIQGIYRLKEDGLDMIQFSRFFMNCLPHQQKQGLFLASGLSQLFKEIAQGHSKIKFSNITDFICQRILQYGQKDQNLHTRWIPTRGHLSNNLQYLSHPAQIKGGKSQNVPKVWHCQSECDKGKHENVIHQAYFSTQQRNLYCLQSLADWIGVYDSDAKLSFKLRPSSFKVKKDAAVMGIAFSQRQQRLGAILKDFSLSFWDAEDNFQFEKSISIAKYCQQLQSAIWYLQFFQKWVTADNSGTIFLWSLIDEKPEKILKCKNKAKVTDICQIPSAKVVAVVQEQRGLHAQATKIQLLGIDSGQVLAEIDTRSERRMLHTLRFSEEHEVLLSAGLEKRISLFHISTTYLDSSLKGELLGHQSAVTCFTLVKRTPMVVSADDKGKVKIWNIKNLKCMQTIDFSDKVIITKLLDLSTQNKIAILGSRIALLHLQKIPQDPVSLAPLRITQVENSFYVFTQKDYRIYNFLNGKVQQINCEYVDSNNQSTFLCILSCGKVVAGNEKGEVAFHDRWRKKTTYNWHNGPIIFIQEDRINNLLVSVSDHTGFMISHCVNQKWEQLRILRGNFIGKELSSIIFTPYHSLLGFVSAGKAYFCDYQQLKIILQVQFQEELPTSLAFANGLGLAFIGTSKGNIHLIQIDRGEIKYGSKLKICTTSITQIIADLKCKEKKQAIQIQSFNLSCSSEGGRIYMADLTGLALQYNFRKSKSGSLSFNPMRQLRENFDAQLKKGKVEILYIISEDVPDINCKITTLFGHKGQISSLAIGEFDEHLLISSGYDNRIKVWLKDRLVGDLNVNRPLPYIWQVQISENRKMARKMLQGLELIQAVFKRFGKDISIAQSRAFKLSIGEKENPQVSTRKLKRKPTLFQQQFTTIDLNYQKIKKQKLIPIGGPSLRKMEMNKIIDNLQKEWDQAKDKEDDQRSKLLKSLQLKAYKNDEKDTVVNILRERSSQTIERRGQNSPAIKNLEERLESSIAKAEEFVQTSRQSSSNMNKSGSLLRFSCRKNRGRDSETRMTFQNYFTEKYQDKMVRNSVKTAIASPQKPQTAQKDQNFRVMLKEMQQRLAKSKKEHLPTLSASKHLRHLSSMTLGSYQ